MTDDNNMGDDKLRVKLHKLVLASYTFERERDIENRCRLASVVDNTEDAIIALFDAERKATVELIEAVSSVVRLSDKPRYRHCQECGEAVGIFKKQYDATLAMRDKLREYEHAIEKAREK